MRTVKGTSYLAAAVLALAGLAGAAAAEPNAEFDRDQIECLALNIYWEARSEPRLSQQAVAHVTLNRVADTAYPNTICEVVYQGEERKSGGCQFSWWCDGRSDRPDEPKAWHRSLDEAVAALKDKSPDPTRGALFFHRDSVAPDWSIKKKRTVRIGRHLYYK